MNSPAHITIQRPFRRGDSFENKLFSPLKQFAEKQKLFTISLSGFGCFESRTIFVDVLDSQELIKLHQELNTFLFGQLNIEKKELNDNITPHITIANRDLNEKEFHRVWSTYKNKSFEAEFKVKSIFLLKHKGGGGNWDTIQEFLFKN